jgi:2-phosphosulfolactate phosphatase
MNVTLSDFVSGARAARGVAIVIDVFRACSVVAHALARGATRVVPVAEVTDARELKRRHPDWLLIGERHARKLPGFDAGNSPTELASLELRGRTIVHTTHAGTQGLTAAASAAELVFAGGDRQFDSDGSCGARTRAERGFNRADGA